MEISENRPALFLSTSLLLRKRGKMDWSRERERERVRQTERSMPDCSTNSKKNKVFFFAVREQ